MERLEVSLHNDPLTEQIVLAAAIVSDANERAQIVRSVPADTFLSPEHKAPWAAIREAVRRGLAVDVATLVRLSGGEADVTYLEDLIQRRPDPPANLKQHIDALLWDRQRHAVLRGPIARLLEQLQDPTSDQEQVRSAARAVAQGFSGSNDHIVRSEEVVRELMNDLSERRSGRTIYGYGIEDLDFYDAVAGAATRARRIHGGSNPAQVTVITGVPGSGKSTITANIVLGLGRDGIKRRRRPRKILYGAWEMRRSVTLELLGCISLGWSRAALTEGQYNDEQLETIRNRAEEISKFVTFARNPFRDRVRVRSKKFTNDENLDLIANMIASSGCEVFIADLWKRALRDARPEEEEEALYQQQAMVEELGVHAILLQQQRLKDVEQRSDRRPTREGIKGSGAWTEVADTILGIHRPAHWKPIPDDVLEVHVLKQRYGKWPVAVEFAWSPETGQIKAGHAIEYEQSTSRDAGGRSIDNDVNEKMNDRFKGKGRR